MNRSYDGLCTVVQLVFLQLSKFRGTALFQVIYVPHLPWSTFPPDIPLSYPLAYLPLSLRCYFYPCCTLRPQTNYFHEGCLGKVPDYHSEPRSKFVHKSGTLGHAVWPEDGVAYNDIWAVIGILMHMGLCRIPKIANHWCTHDLCDFLPVCARVTQYLFHLVHGRVLYFALTITGNQGSESEEAKKR